MKLIALISCNKNIHMILSHLCKIVIQNVTISKLFVTVLHNVRH